MAAGRLHGPPLKSANDKSLRVYGKKTVVSGRQQRHQTLSQLTLLFLMSVQIFLFAHGLLVCVKKWLPGGRINLLCIYVWVDMGHMKVSLAHSLMATNTSGFYLNSPA